MTWKPGQSGNPKGGPKDKICADLLRVVVNENDETGVRKIRRIMEKLATKALEGEPWAIMQVCDRLDGKPAQESTVTIDDKRDATDWTRRELVAFLNDAAARGNGTAKTNGRGREPDSVH